MWIKQNKLKLNECKLQDGVPIKRSAQCNQILSGVVCVIGFLFIFTTVILNVFTFNNETLESEIPHTKMIDFSYCTMQPNCDIICSNLNKSHNITEVVEMEFSKRRNSLCKNTINTLKFNKISFERGIMRKNWFNPRDFRVKRLEISGENIANVEPEAFNGEIFRSSTSLLLERLTIEDFDDKYFANMTSLKELNIRDCNILRIHKNVLAPIASSLSTLQIQQMRSKFDPVNFTGTVKMVALATIDFRFNPYSIDLTSESFASTPFCVDVYLGLSNIHTIGDKAFAKMIYLQQISLNQNALETLQESVFHKNVKNKVRIFVEGNHWRCDCDLAWMKKKKADNLISGDPFCASPPEAKDKHFDDVNFCDNGSPSTENPVISSSSTTTTPLGSKPTSTETIIDEGTVNIDCSLELIQQKEKKRKSLRFVRDTSTIQISKQTVNFQIDDNGDGKIKILVNTTITKDEFLIWFNKATDLSKHSPDKIGCITNITNTSNVEVENLDVGESYSFCFIHDGELLVSPLNCRSHVVELPLSRRTWLSNADKPIMLGSVGGGLVLCWLLGAIAIYFLIRTKPSLLRGSKRVVMVKAKNTDVIVMPPSYCSKESQKGSDRESTRTYNMEKSFKRNAFRRSISETSIVSVRSIEPSYISAYEPTKVQLINWRLERLERMERLKSRMGSDYYIEPPPLPPKFSPPSPIPNDYESISSITEA